MTALCLNGLRHRLCVSTSQTRGHGRDLLSVVRAVSHLAWGRMLQGAFERFGLDPALLAGRETTARRDCVQFFTFIDESRYAHYER
jgi:hypothetical protein